MNSRNAQETVIPAVKRQDVQNDLRQILKNGIPQSILIIKPFTISNCVTRIWTEVNDLSGVQYFLNKSMKLLC